MIIRKTVKLIYGDDKVETKLLFREVPYETAKRMMLKNHYSHKWNANFGRINIGVYKDNELLGCASFGNLMNPKSYKSICGNFEKENVVELNRLWVDDCLGKNVETVLLGASWKIIKSDFRDVKAIQSFADGRLGVGTIYKASSFKYYGFAESIFFIDKETNITYHHVPFENTKRPDGMIKLNTLLIQNRLKSIKVKTYRYIFCLYKNIKIDLKPQKYPKYEKGYQNMPIKINNNIIIRAYVLAYLLNYQEKEILQEWVLENIDKNEIYQALKNESIIMISKERNVYQKYLEILDGVDIMFNTKIQKKEQLSLF